MYIVKAIAIVGGDETYTFDNKQDALEKVRWFKDLGGFIVTMTELTQETVSQFKQATTNRKETMANIFSTPKELKTWAIKLANACGGQKVEKSNILTKINMQRVNELLGQFEQDHTVMIAKQQQEEIDLSNDEQQLADKKEEEEQCLAYKD